MSRKSALYILVVLVLTASWPASASANTPRQVRRALRRGAGWLASQSKNGRWPVRSQLRFKGRAEALAALAILSADPVGGADKLRQTLNYLRAVDAQTVATRALRVMVFSRLSSEQYGRQVEADVKWLIAQQRPDGGWGYGPGHPAETIAPNWRDNGNSQLAVVALGDAVAAGVEVDQAVWDRCASYWQAGQNADGGWGFEPPGESQTRIRPQSYGPMTAGAVTAMMLVREPTGLRGRRLVNPLPQADAIDRGLAWLRANASFDATPGWVWGAGDEWRYFYLYRLARTLNEAGMRQFAGGDWVAELADRLVAEQRPDGSWPVPKGGGEPSDPIIRTCYAMLALAEADRPVLISRLSLSDMTQYNSRDAANFVRWFAMQMDSPAGWQQVRADDPNLAAAIAEAPILYISEPKKTKIPDTIHSAIRKFVNDGGMVLIQSYGGGGEFYQYSRQLIPKVLRRLRQGRLRAKHPIFRVQFPLDGERAPAGIVFGDNLRARVFILSSDIGGMWHINRPTEGAEAFQFAANLALYATDRHPLGGRLAARAQPPAPAPPQRWINIARVKYRGDWDVCPGATEQLSRTLTEALSIGIRQGDPVDLTAPVPQNISLLWMTGTGSAKLSEEQIDRLRRYIEGGGSLLIDRAIGKGRLFMESRATLQRMFGPEQIKRIGVDSPLLTGAFAGGIGGDVRKVSYTYPVAASRPQLHQPLLWGVEQDGRVAVVLSPFGITCPVEGLPTYGCEGYLPYDARRLAANIVLYAAMQE